ncbi:MAG: glutamine synthetase family protein [Silicimonas sp.]|jgi:glutamine synthetase|nr:glutamine synthetase family protein [Silicimonas sp.]
MSWLDDFPDTRTVWTGIADLNGQARGKRLPATRARKLDDGSAKMPLSVLSLDIFGDDIEDSPLVFESGDKDGFLRPTERGGVPMPWLRSHSLLLPMTMEVGPGRPFHGDPRQALARVLERYAARGWSVQAATELEFYLIDENDPDPLTTRLRAGGDILGLRSLEAYDPFLAELYTACGTMGIPAETATSESGMGQFEVTLTHGPAMKAADDTWFFKMLTRGLSHKHDMLATFMSKPFPEDSGTGLHMHFSILDAEGRNIFDDGTDRGSETLRHAVGGCLSTMRDATLIFAPHENSYRRLITGSHAPTGICWGYENRTVAVRIPDGPGNARRIEHRVAGGDTNPYLLFSVVLGAALLGIEDRIEPPAPLEGNAYEEDCPSLAPDWAEAIDRFEASDAMKRLFHPDLIDQYVRTKRQELFYVAELTDEEKHDLYLDRV